MNFFFSVPFFFPPYGVVRGSQPCLAWTKMGSLAQMVLFFHVADPARWGHIIRTAPVRGSSFDLLHQERDVKFNSIRMKKGATHMTSDTQRKPYMTRGVSPRW